MAAGLLAQTDGVRQHAVGHAHRGQVVLHLKQILRVSHRADLLQRIAVPLCVDDLHLVFEGRVADGQADHETVDLALRQRLRTGRTQRILGRNADKRRGQRVRFAVHRDGVLLHDLKQRGLRFR